MKKKVELLAPAGDLDRLKVAIKYGADAVYLAGERFGLRANAANFSLEDLKAGVQYAHERGVKIHVTMNIVPHDEDLEGIVDYIKELDRIGVDCLIISDPGIFQLAKDNSSIDLHISTQASVTNSQTINFRYKQGAKRIVLARELSLEEIKKIRKSVPEDLELEVFAHGAMCISYSGRCLLSNYMTGRDANKGDCAQACRRKYSLQEETRPGEYFPVFEDDGGTFIMNSKDLCLLGDLDKLIEAGVDSFKIEGRMKTEYYVATVVRSYRQAIDAYYKGTYNEETVQKYLEEIEKASHRHFTKGFLEGKPDSSGQNYGSSSYIRDYDFIGLVTDYDKENKLATIEQRNRFFVGDEIEIFGNSPDFQKLVVEKILNEKGEEVPVANHPKEKLQIKVKDDVEVGDMLRKKL